MKVEKKSYRIFYVNRDKYRKRTKHFIYTFDTLKILTKSKPILDSKKLEGYVIVCLFKPSLDSSREIQQWDHMNEF